MHYQQVSFGGFEFWFNTFSDDPVLRELQLWLVQAELLQAIGRAYPTPLRFEATTKPW